MMLEGRQTSRSTRGGDRSAEPPSSFRPPAAFDEITLLRRLGSGGMGDVYLARDMLLDRLVAVKFLSAIHPDTGGREQLLQEARAAARLQHPNVVSIYRVGEIDGHPFIISEFVRGRSLDALERPVPWRRALELGIGLARGLAAAHRRGVLHRDIKPGNAILTEDGEVKLLDFGLAKLVEGHSRPSLTPLPGLPPPLPIAPAVPRPDLDPADITVRSLPPLCAGAATRSQVSGPVHVTALAGTPLYMAPELWQGEPASPRSDVHALGLVLFELCAGAHPLADLDPAELPHAACSSDAPLLLDAAPSVDPSFAAVVDRCLRRDPAERFASGDELREALEALEQLVAAARQAALPEGNPYRGLLPFEAEDRALFFGRAAEIGAVLDRLRAEPAVVIAGDSGVGKSSLCAAGVAPLVLDGALGDGRFYAARRLAPGRRPLAALAAALATLLELEEERLAALLADPAALAREVRLCLGQDRGVLLVVDHLEELLTLAPPREARRFGEALAQLTARCAGVRMLMTVRSDFLTRAAALPGLGDALARGLYLLRPLSPDLISEAIVGPARAKGVAFESAALIDKLVASTSSAEGLPLLQFALAELWAARTDPAAPITEAALEAIGGVAGALARHADGVLLALPAAQRAAARRLLLGLITLEGTRARRGEAELVAGDLDARAAIEALVRGRLLVVQEAEDGPVVEIAHEALLRGWGTLRRWLDEQQGSRPVRRRLEAAAAEWERLGLAREALWGAAQLAEAAALDGSDLGPRDGAFLAASRRAAARHRLAWGAALLGAPLAVLLGYAAVELEQRRAVDTRVTGHVREASAASAGADREEAALEALRVEAFAAFDAGREQDGEERWARALALSAKIEHLRVRAGHALEAALSHGGDREDIRDALAELLYRRALAAEREGAAARRDELLDRLALYDHGGERARRWEAPAELRVETDPPGAQITLARYVEGPRRSLGLAAPEVLGRSPLPPIDLARGSYLLTAEASGRAPVRYPVLVGRGERLRVSVPLPRAAEIPPGFIYIPPGRYLSGTASDDTLRQSFLSASPLHPVETGAYLIARHETTWAEWIAFLEAQPPRERARRAPKVGAAGLAGAVELTRLRDGVWQLTLQPTLEPHTARAGEQITYTRRTRHATQDWLKLPVSGITRSDAEAYTTWLRATGRVAGARLCTEHEWERAARGADDREFPNGHQLDANDANVDTTYGPEVATRGPDQVGLHPASRSPFGAEDMAGNVFEWTTSTTPGGPSIIRGGAYYYEPLTARIANRTRFAEDLRDPRLGLRVCASFPGAPARGSGR